MELNVLRSSLLAAASALPLCVQAGSPMVVDDANIATAGNCQLESWWRAGRDDHDAWLLPACNPEGHVEFSLGLNRHHAADADMQVLALQAKTLWQPLDGHNWGAGLALGALWQDDVPSGAPRNSDLYVYFPLSFAYADREGALHINLGVRSDRLAGREKFTWGLGTSRQFLRRSSVLAEIYGESGVSPSWQAGWRWALLPDRLELDTTVSDGTTEPLRYALGLRWLDIF